MNLRTGQMNKRCDPHDYNLYGGNLSYNGPIPVAADGSFQINDSYTTGVDNIPANETVAITGHVANGIASGTYHVTTSFNYNGAYTCTTGDQTWTATLTP